MSLIMFEQANFMHNLFISINNIYTHLRTNGNLHIYQDSMIKVNSVFLSQHFFLDYLVLLTGRNIVILCVGIKKYDDYDISKYYLFHTS